MSHQWLKEERKRANEFYTSPGAVCAMISDFPKEKIKMVEGWCRWLLKRKQTHDAP